MSVGIVIASHGEFAAGIKQSGQMIFGEQENVQAVYLRPEEGPEDIRSKMEKAIASFDDQEEVLFLIDLWGGTPFNQANQLVEGHKDKWAIVTGLNLPMLIEAYASRFSMNTAREIAEHIISTAKEGVKPYPEDIAPIQEEAKASQDATTGRPGKFEYVLARVDSRLLHGQVATSWTKTTNPTRIIVVSDAVAKDDLRKQMIMQAAPSGVHAHVVPVDQMIKLAKDDQHFGGQRALLLFENPEDALRVIEGGVPLEEINLGSMSHSKGKVQPDQVLAFDQKDIDTIKKLQSMGVKFDMRKVPSDGQRSLDDILKKAQDELNKLNA